VSRPIITLLTDYGPATEHVGALHAVLAASAPNADRIDLAHDIPLGEVRWGAILLARLAPLVPRAAHVAVVDPGVGTARRAIAIETSGGAFLIGPDNGLLGLAAELLGVAHVVELSAPDGTPATFHGRDLFAPAAARLVAGAAIADLGQPIDSQTITYPSMPEPDVTSGRLVSELALWDRFGNVQLVAGAGLLGVAGVRPGNDLTVQTAGRVFPARCAETFATEARGALLVYADSHGRVALAVNRGSASDLFGAATAQTVEISRGTSS
jgi:S-adenosyl-L-methionine hydrolase (adenosine-forming)